MGKNLEVLICEDALHSSEDILKFFNMGKINFHISVPEIMTVDSTLAAQGRYSRFMPNKIKSLHFNSHIPLMGIKWNFIIFGPNQYQRAKEMFTTQLIPKSTKIFVIRDEFLNYESLDGFQVSTIQFISEYLTELVSPKKEKSKNDKSKRENH